MSWTVTWPNSTDSMDTLYDPNFTYHYDKVSCMRGAWFAHVIFCYLVFLSGIFCCECLGQATKQQCCCRFTGCYEEHTEESAVCMQQCLLHVAACREAWLTCQLRLSLDL